MAFLTNLPTELMCNIADLLKNDNRDFNNFRLTCKDIKDKIKQPFLVKYFTYPHVELTIKGLDRLYTISRSADYAPRVRALCFRPVFLDDRVISEILPPGLPDVGYFRITVDEHEPKTLVGGPTCILYSERLRESLPQTLERFAKLEHVSILPLFLRSTNGPSATGVRDWFMANVLAYIQASNSPDRVRSYTTLTTLASQVLLSIIARRNSKPLTGFQMLDPDMDTWVGLLSIETKLYPRPALLSALNGVERVFAQHLVRLQFIYGTTPPALEEVDVNYSAVLGRILGHAHNLKELKLGFAQRPSQTQLDAMVFLPLTSSGAKLRLLQLECILIDEGWSISTDSFDAQSENELQHQGIACERLLRSQAETLEVLLLRSFSVAHAEVFIRIMEAISLEGFQLKLCQIQGSFGIDWRGGKVLNALVLANGSAVMHLEWAREPTRPLDWKGDTMEEMYNALVRYVRNEDEE